MRRDASTGEILNVELGTQVCFGKAKAGVVDNGSLSDLADLADRVGQL
jgi:hypothetical protein